MVAKVVVEMESPTVGSPCALDVSLEIQPEVLNGGSGVTSPADSAYALVAAPVAA